MQTAMTISRVRFSPLSFRGAEATRNLQFSFVREELQIPRFARDDKPLEDAA